MEAIGLIAGNGRFPILFARAARAEGMRVVACAHRGETESEIESVCDAVTWIRVGELGKMIRTFRRAGVKRAVMAGGIQKTRVLTGFRPDWRGAAFLARTLSHQDDSLLRGIAREFESDGIEIVSSTLLCPELLTPAGVLTRREPSAEAWQDVAIGFRAAKGLGAYDIGQSVVVQGRVVLAAEAVEGTDACLRRAAGFGRKGLSLVKVCKPGQDERFDVPAVGRDTIDVLQESSGAVLALEAGRTLMIDGDDMLSAADAAGIAIVGVDAQWLAARFEGKGSGDE